MNLSDHNKPSASTRLADTRRTQWHQQGEALLTIENARSFLNAAGLVLFAPRPQIAAPAPSFVEAVLGASNASPALAQIAEARALLARLVAEGLAVPLNLLGIGSVIGQPGDAPDFIASAQVFSYIFTLRGDKAWKQPPQVTGPVKFSNLAVATHEALTRRGPMTAYELAGELGKEVTESAALRALGELWSYLRALPIPQLDGRPTVWELAGARLTRQLKAGANAGVPAALSALISLYLGQAILATEDEVESFLSPLAARSRVRDVVHALIAARQLETVAIEGKTMLHVAGAAPAFLTEETLVAPDAVEEADAAIELGASTEASPTGTAEREIEEHGEIAPPQPNSRIAKFVPKQKPGPRELSKARPTKFARKPFHEKKPFAPRERRERSSFRDAQRARLFEKRPDFKRAKPGVDAPESRAERDPGFRDKGKRQFDKKRFTPKDAGFKPRFEKREGASKRPEGRPFVRRERGGEDRPKRWSNGRTDRDRPSRRPFDGSGGHGSARKPFDRSGDRAAEGRSFGAPRRFGREREFASEDRPNREFKPKSVGRPKPFGRREQTREGGKRHGEFSERKPSRRSDRPGSNAFRARERGEGRPGGSFGGKRSADRRFGGGAKFGGEKFGGAKPGGKKFGGRKSFGKPKGGRGSKPSQGDAEA